MTILLMILTLGFYAGLAMLFGFIANFSFKRSSPVQRAAYVAMALGALLTIPAFAAVARSSNNLVAVLAVMVGTVLLAALAFPPALFVTRRRPVEPDHDAFN